MIAESLPAGMRPMHVLLVEDNRDIAANVFEYFEPRGHVLDYASDGPSGVRLALDNNPDLIVLDLALPGMDGLDVCRAIRAQTERNVPILMLTARDRLEDKLAGFEAGADDYLVKPFSLQELEARLIALDRRARNIGQEKVLRVADLEYDTRTQQARRAGRVVKLSTTTRTLLACLMANSDRVVSRQELEREIWGDDPPEGDVLRAHVYALRTAIDKPFEKKLLHTIHGSGYRVTDETV